MYQYSFEKLEVWQCSRVLVKEIYNLTANFPPKENYGLSSQIQRAVVSVASNIAEGMGRTAEKEQIRFLEISYGSLMETYCQICLSLDLAYINQDQFDNLKTQIDKIANKINGLSKSIKERLNNKQSNEETK